MSFIVKEWKKKSHISLFIFFIGYLSLFFKVITKISVLVSMMASSTEEDDHHAEDPHKSDLWQQTLQVDFFSFYIIGRKFEVLKRISSFY